MDLEAIRGALGEAGLDGWLFYDVHHRDMMAYRILGLDDRIEPSRRWFYLIPATGQPVKLAHRVEPGRLASLPGEQRHYLAYTELHDELRRMVEGRGRLAMQYSPDCNVPQVSVADAGTVELIRSFGAEIVSSADLVQRFEAVMDDAAFDSHRRAGQIVQRIKDDAYALMDRALRDGDGITEFEVREFILGEFAGSGLTSDGAVPIVGFNDHPADPHFEPTAENAYTLARGDTILIDLWARRDDPTGVYYDVTWCGYAGDDPPSRYREIWDTVCRARDAALDSVRAAFAAGRPIHGSEVDDAARRVVREAGYGDRFLHRTGHNIGREVHGNGANIDNLETRDDRALLPGTCFSIEPGIYLEGSMAVRTEIDVFITPAGAVEVVGPIQSDLILIG